MFFSGALKRLQETRAAIKSADAVVEAIVRTWFQNVQSLR
jgi:hypothetical protein